MADCHIMKLTDDCLINVFSYLPNVRDKFRLELVCKRVAKLAVAKSSAWKGYDSLKINIDGKLWWTRLSQDEYFCEINDIKVRLVDFPQALRSILQRTTVHHLSFYTRKRFRDCKLPHKAAFHDTFSEMLPILTSYSAKFKLFSFAFEGNIKEFMKIFFVLGNSYFTLRKFEYSGIQMWYTIYSDLAFPELWNFLSKCQSLGVFKFKLDWGSDDFTKDFNGQVVLKSLLRKPLKELHFVHHYHYIKKIEDRLTPDQYAQICNNVCGSGITHLTMQSIGNLGAFLNKLNERSRLSLLHMECPGSECKAGTLLQFLPNIGKTVPNFRSIKVKIDESRGSIHISSRMFPKSLIGFFNGMQNCEPSGRLFEINWIRVDISDDADRDSYKEGLRGICEGSRIHVTFGNNSVTVFQKANVRLVIKSFEVMKRESEDEDDDEN